MKFLRFILILSLLLLIGSVHSQSKQICSAIHIYRPSSFSNSLVTLKIYVNNKEIKGLKNNSALKISISEPGEYQISARWDLRGETFRLNTIKNVNITCGTSSTYFKIKNGTLQAANLLTLVHEENGKKDLEKINSNNRYNFGFGKNTSSPIDFEQKKEINKNEKLNRSSETVISTQEKMVSTINTEVKDGNYYALIIGVNDYNDYRMNDLDQPIADATKLVDVLLRKYTFKKENLIFLKNPSKDQITKTLDDYFKKLSTKDNLFIFYAGHGYWDEKFKQGYWLATDASKENRGTWLSNGTIRDYIRAIPSKHTLLVTDACFGGGIFKSRSAFTNASTAIDELYKLPSRKAMTSGAMKEVPDKSVFIQYLVKRLEQNTDKHLSSEQLFASFKIAVINNSSNGQVPQFGEIKETGDEGGDYIFIKK